jgi:RNA polymerase sigma-70 factor (ECF subfamily)
MSTCDTHVTESGTLAFRVALSVLRHREDAEDVAQEAVVRSLQRFDSLKDRTRFRAWLVRIAWRLALDRRRSDARRAARDFHFVGNDSAHFNTEHDLIVRERADRLWSAIDTLPPRLRLPLVLGTLQGHSLEEVASILDVPVGTVKSRTFEARRKLKRALVDTGMFACLTGLLLGGLWIHHIVSPDIAPVRPAPVQIARDVTAPAPAAASAPVRSVAPAVADMAPGGVSGADPIRYAPATVEIPLVEVPVLPVPVITLPTLKPTKIEVPIVNAVPAGTPETPQEK